MKVTGTKPQEKKDNFLVYKLERMSEDEIDSFVDSEITNIDDIKKLLKALLKVVSRKE